MSFWLGFGIGVAVGAVLAVVAMATYALIVVREDEEYRLYEAECTRRGK